MIDKLLFLIDKALQLVFDLFLTGLIWLICLSLAMTLLAYLGGGIFLAYDKIRKHTKGRPRRWTALNRKEGNDHAHGYVRCY